MSPPNFTREISGVYHDAGGVHVVIYLPMMEHAASRLGSIKNSLLAVNYCLVTFNSYVLSTSVCYLCHVCYLFGCKSIYFLLALIVAINFLIGR